MTCESQSCGMTDVLTFLKTFISSRISGPPPEAVMQLPMWLLRGSKGRWPGTHCSSVLIMQWVLVAAEGLIVR